MEETETVWTLADFGALLRERRIHKGLAEEDVAAQLKITSRLVKAIEEGDMEAMPHAVYARGFIRAYAKLLAVDDSITHAACALLRDPEEELREQEVRVVPTAARREERHVPWLAILLCALFLAGGAWYFRDSIPGLVGGVFYDCPRSGSCCGHDACRFCRAGCERDASFGIRGTDCFGWNAPAC